MMQVKVLSFAHTTYSKPAYTAIEKIDDKPIELLTLNEIKAWSKNKIKPEIFTPWPYQQETLSKLAFWHHFSFSLMQACYKEIIIYLKSFVHQGIRSLIRPVTVDSLNNSLTHINLYTDDFVFNWY
jgi:hypothetical protein